MYRYFLFKRAKKKTLKGEIVSRLDQGFSIRDPLAKRDPPICFVRPAFICVCSLHFDVREEHLMGVFCPSVCAVSFHRRDHAAIYQWSCELFVLTSNNSRMAEQIFMKFGMNVMPLEATPNSYF
jgi:hypothetical protein